MGSVVPCRPPSYDLKGLRAVSLKPGVFQGKRTWHGAAESDLWDCRSCLQGENMLFVYSSPTLANIGQSRTNQDPAFFEENWSSLLESLSSDASVPTLQCLSLAQMYCMTKGDYKALLRYRSLGVNISQQLGLHQSQKHSTNVLEVETRKKVFWCIYVLDRYVHTVCPGH